MKKSQCNQGYANYLKGKLYGILQDCEKGKNYDGLLESLQSDLIGALEEYDSIQMVNLFHKISSLKFLKYKYFRKTVMDCMKLIDIIFSQE